VGVGRIELSDKKIRKAFVMSHKQTGAGVELQVALLKGGVGQEETSSVKGERVPVMPLKRVLALSPSDCIRKEQAAKDQKFSWGSLVRRSETEDLRLPTWTYPSWRQ